MPLFAATLAPEAHPEVAEALKHVGGFDSVDDESRAEVAFEACRGTEAGAWAADGRNPHYAWQLYHLWANVAALNSLRRASVNARTACFVAEYIPPVPVGTR